MPQVADFSHVAKNNSYAENDMIGTDEFLDYCAS